MNIDYLSIDRVQEITFAFLLYRYAANAFDLSFKGVILIRVLIGPPGCGKTEALHSTMLSAPGRWVLALPRTSLADEQAAALSAKALRGRTPVTIEAIHSAQPNKRGKVGRRVQDALRDHAASSHAVVLLTHEALLDLDPVLLRGWGVQGDEMPDGGVLSGQFAAGIGWMALAGLYRLVPVADSSSWHRVVPRDDVELPTIGQIMNDNALVPFHKAVLSRERTVFVDVASWEDAKGARRKVRWYSCWTPAGLLEHASSVTFAGAGVFDSLMYHAAQQCPAGPIKFESIDISAQNPRTARPTVVIYYYTRHRGGTTWWQTEEGSRCLVAISRYLEGIGFKGYWSGNDVVRPYFRHRFDGVECQPKVAGTNSLRHHTRCAFFYSNKAQAADDAVLEVLGLSRDDIRRAREDEDIIQFCHRGAVRDGSFGGTYEIHLYSLDQAERLKEYLVAKGITDDVRLIGVEEAGIMEVQRPEAKAGSRPPKADPMTAQQRAEKRQVQAQKRMQRKRDKDKAVKVANGTVRPRGRPRKAEPVAKGTVRPQVRPKKAA